MQAKTKKNLRRIGNALAVIGIVFVAIRFRDYGGQIDFKQLSWMIWLWIACFSFIYGAANVMLAIAWWNLLNHFGSKTSVVWAINVYGITQLAKYVPGNIMHFAGRQAVGMAAEVDGLTLVKSTICELGLLALAGSIFATFVLPLLVPGFPLIISVLLFFLTTSIIVVTLAYSFCWKMIYSFACYIFFLIVLGALFVGLLYTVNRSEISEMTLWLLIGGAYVVAWLVGLMTPGAPAGIGVREMVLLLLLKGVVNEADLLLAAMFSRVVTVAGDALFFSVASINTLPPQAGSNG